MDVTRNCGHCGEVFTPRRGGKPQKFCSATCRIASHRPPPVERPTTVPAPRRPTTKLIVCAECGTEVEVSTRGTPRQFCTHKCAVRASNRRWGRARLPLANPTSKNCAHCGSAFVAKSRDRIYCYDKWCAQAAYSARRAAGESGRVGSRLVKCDGCGLAFTSVRPEARWCSKRCANRHWGNVRARQRVGPSGAKYTDLQIFERDGWRCHLCRKLVRRDVSRLHPEGATIDHLVPITDGGLDEPANVATAHWKCNRDKGIRAMNEQLAVF